MKQNFHSYAVLFVLLIISSHASARILETNHGKEEAKLNNKTTGDSLVQIEGSNYLNTLMGIEDCESGDEECLKRRVLAEAHLDYIYTQHHKP